MNKSQSQQEVYKIILVGDQGVGKSSILLRYTKDLFNREYNVTIGLEFASKKVTVYDYALTLQIWDTAGQEAFRSIAKIFLQKFCCNHNCIQIDKSRFILKCLRMGKRYPRKQRSRSCNIFKAERSVSNEEGKQKAQEINSLYFETSAAIGKNIDDIFINTLEKVTKQINPIRTDCEQNVRDSIHLSQKYQSQPKINQENNGGIKPKQTESPKKGCC
ncbi:unnamed protein product (macronuclear) [Paramecium tetraurelia]|uniref:Uncharacterized protein n=1 Tax=Paramecium tetraurelia TaxID=5888 RepID=A0E7C8_PARTE|nr:uncharacterized protein GSPATT00023923001 [Paramecium tetraurelia]CAK91195.1 unnamed protein product [Paramecium tetraurelia]|eukprot:XP_001458592.1 hypothetical protein (macronuclear) [Paramecium tetraurelia strain d4-2]